MNFKSSTFVTVCANLLFCFVVIAFFGRNTMLRLPAVGALYKEYLSGCIVLLLFYFQKMVIYPKIRFGIITRYLWIGLFAAMIAATLEMLLVFPQVMEILMSNLSKKESFRVLLSFSLFIFLRDIGFLVASYFVSEFKSQAQLCDTYEIRIRQTAKEIPVMPVQENKRRDMISLPSSFNEKIFRTDEKNSVESEPSSCDSNFANSDCLNGMQYLPITEIWYCIQMKNTLFVHSLNDKLYFRSNSLKKIKHLVGEQLFFQVSRDTLVMRKYITHVSDRFVETTNPITKEKRTFDISDAYLTDELIFWKPEKNIVNHEQLDDFHITKESKPTEYANRPNPLKEKRIKTIYSYISKHPYCKNPAISEKTKIPVGTVNRILADLKKEGRIEYVGSKKTGGYYLVNIPQESEVAGPVLQEEACSISS